MWRNYAIGQFFCFSMFLHISTRYNKFMLLSFPNNRGTLEQNQEEFDLPCLQLYTQLCICLHQ